MAGIRETGRIRGVHTLTQEEVLVAKPFDDVIAWAEENKDLLAFIKETLDGEVTDVRLSHKLKSHPVCLTTEGEITLEVEKYFRSLPGANTENLKAQKVLELNGEHPAFAALQKAFAEDKDRAAKLSKILLAQAKLIADIPLDDPSAYAELVCGLF